MDGLFFGTRMTKYKCPVDTCRQSAQKLADHIRHLVGSSRTDALESMCVGPVMRKIIVFCYVNEKCRACSVAALCRGGCCREREPDQWALSF